MAISNERRGSRSGDGFINIEEIVHGSEGLELKAEIFETFALGSATPGRVATIAY